MPDVQTWANNAAEQLAALRGGMTPQQWGTAVHKRVEDQIKVLKEQAPNEYRDIDAEISIDPEHPKEQIPRGRPGSTRLDVLEEVKPGLVCVYDVKTGNAELTTSRVNHIAALVLRRYGLVTFFIIEVRPAE